MWLKAIHTVYNLVSVCVVDICPKILQVKAIHQRVQRTAEPSTVIQTVREEMNPSSSLFRRENTSFQKFASSTLEVTYPSTIDPQWFFSFAKAPGGSFFLSCFDGAQCWGDFFVINNVGPILSVPQFLYGCSRYHSSCQSYSSPTTF